MVCGVYMNEKWFALSLSEIEKKLKTNAATGLSRKAARSRFSQKYRTVFSVPIVSAVSYLVDILGDFAYIMLMAMSVLALCFGETETGTVATVCILINLFVAFFTYYRSQFLGDALERVFLPRCRVVRDGKLFRIGASSVVRGDIIMLEEGDIVPADARLITSDSLKVKMLFEREKFLILDKAAESIVYENENDPSKYSNMVHAASIVLSGNARAVVTEVGQFTYVGARIGNIPSVSRGRNRVPRLLSLFKKYVSKLSIILLLTVLPFSVLSILFGNTTLSLFTAFITAIAVAASCMTQISVTVCKAFYTTSIRKCLTAEASSVIRSSDAMDKLAGSKYIFFLDGAVISDGVLHFEGAYTADGEVNLEKPVLVGDTAKKLGELAALYDSAQKSSLSVSAYTFYKYESAVKEFADKICADRGALKIRCGVTGFVAAAEGLRESSDRLFYTELGEKYVLSVSYGNSGIDECAECMLNGKRVEMDDSVRRDLGIKYNNYIRTGKRVLVFSVDVNHGDMSFSDRCFVGMVVLSERADGSASSALRTLENMGVKPVFFSNVMVDGRIASVPIIPAEIMGDRSVSPSEIMASGKPVLSFLSSVRSYTGFSDAQISSLIDSIHAKGDTVAVAGFSQSFDRIYQKADVMITYSSDEYKVMGRFEQEIDVLGSPDDMSRSQVAEVVRRRADILIPRPESKKRGGCASLLRAYANSLTASVNAVRFFRYVVCMQMVRILLVMTPMLFGSTALDARHILLGGMIADLFVMFSFMTEKHQGLRAVDYKYATCELSNLLRYNFSAAIAFGGGALIASLLPELVSLFPNVPKYIDKTEYSLVVFVLFHIVAFFCFKLDIRKDNIDGLKSLRSRIRPLTIVYPILLIVLLVLCFVEPSVASMFDIEGFSSPMFLFIATLPPIFSAILYFFKGNEKFDFKSISFINK